MNTVGSFRDTVSALPRIGWEAAVLLTLTAFCFMFVPYPEFITTTGAWFGVGWPISTGSFKVGHVSPESPSGVHPHIHLAALVNLVLWLAVYFGLRWAANHEALFIFLRVALRVICFVGAMLFIVATTYIISNLHNNP